MIQKAKNGIETRVRTPSGFEKNRMQAKWPEGIRMSDRIIDIGLNNG